MAQVLCAVDDSAAAGKAVEQAVAFCREQGRDLRLVGLVDLPRFGPPQPAHAEQVRRYKAVQFRLLQATQAARQTGLQVEIAVRAGDPATVLLAEADATGAGEVFLARARGRIASAITGRPRLEVAHIKVADVPRLEVEEALRKAA